MSLRLPTDFEKRKTRIKDYFVRKNRYKQFPNLINKWVASLWNIQCEDSWEQFYDSLLHIQTLYAIRLKVEVCYNSISFSVCSNINDLINNT